MPSQTTTSIWRLRLVGPNHAFHDQTPQAPIRSAPPRKMATPDFLPHHHHQHQLCRSYSSTSRLATRVSCTGYGNTIEMTLPRGESWRGGLIMKWGLSAVRELFIKSVTPWSCRRLIEALLGNQDGNIQQVKFQSRQEAVLRPQRRMAHLLGHSRVWHGYDSVSTPPLALTPY